MLIMGLVMAFPLLGIPLFFLLPLRQALPIYLFFTGVSGLCHWVMMHSMRLPVRTGGEAMIGSLGVVLHWEGRSGQIKWRGEIWQAETMDGGSLASGDRVVVNKLSGLTLLVRFADSKSQAMISR